MEAHIEHGAANIGFQADSTTFFVNNGTLSMIFWHDNSDGNHFYHTIGEEQRCSLNGNVGQEPQPASVEIKEMQSLIPTERRQGSQIWYQIIMQVMCYTTFPMKETFQLEMVYVTIINLPSRAMTTFMNLLVTTTFGL